jgi:hypothetical protein
MSMWVNPVNAHQHMSRWSVFWIICRIFLQGMTCHELSIMQGREDQSMLMTQTN